MKKQSLALFSQISKQALENLTSSTQETLATGYQNSTSKIFTSADLWNIQRQGKTRIQRRLSF